MYRVVDRFGATLTAVESMNRFFSLIEDMRKDGWKKQVYNGNGVANGDAHTEIREGFDLIAKPCMRTYSHHRRVLRLKLKPNARGSMEA